MGRRNRGGSGRRRLRGVPPIMGSALKHGYSRADIKEAWLTQRIMFDPLPGDDVIMFGAVLGNTPVEIGVADYGGLTARIIHFNVLQSSRINVMDKRGPGWRTRWGV